MGYNVEKLFEDVAYLSKVHTKKDYEMNMKMFKENRYEFLEPIIKASDVAADAKVLCDEVNTAFKKFGKVRGSDMMNINYFMIYYVFPSLLTEENGSEICDTVKSVWNAYFKCNIDYTDYETLLNGFQTRIFGIPIGKN
ncbi:MAG: hypothetical protein K6E79_06635 [Pseudobutyrivibrio sp.]|nr:hypothetical protein [Pseudobutyrivibrio sp.]